MLSARSERSYAEQRLADLQLWALSSGASLWMIDLSPHVTSRVVGMVERLVIDPVEGHIEATVTDGTARVVARWGLTRPAAQLVIAPGRGVLLEGVASVDDDGLVMLEPTFELVDSIDAA